MKIKGKIIAVLATLGLLLTMMSSIPAAGATAGKVTISGGVTNESVDWFSLKSSYNRVGVTVTDADENKATDLVGSCTSGTLTFKCELVGQGGEGTGTGTSLGKNFSVSNTPMVDRNSDDIPDSVTVRSLQAQQSFLLSTASAAGGTLTLSAATAANTYSKLAATAVGADTVATALTTQVTQPSLIEIVFTDVSAGDALGTSGVTLAGTTVAAATLVATASATEDLGASADLAALDTDSDGTVKIRSTNYFSSVSSFAVDHSAGSFSIAINELETVATGYQYDGQDTVTSKVTITDRKSVV